MAESTEAVREVVGSLVEFVLTMTDRALARMWVDFNRWEWPRDLPGDFKPYWWGGLPMLDPREIRARKSGFIDPFMDYAKARVSDAMIGEEWEAATTRAAERAATQTEER